LLRVGLTGGIACGKSTVARMLLQKGALLIDADELAREVVSPGTPAFEEITAWLGDTVVADDGTLDRSRIADLVFGDCKNLKKLNSIVHPRVIELFCRKSGRLQEQFPGKLQVWEVPLLFEARMEALVDLIVVVASSEQNQVQRLMHRDGLSREEALRRLQSQLPLRDKINRADVVIYNNGSFKDLQEQVDRLWDELKKRT